MQTNNNVSKCGHARCAGGNGLLCYEKGKGMRTYEDIKKELEIKARLEYLRNQINQEFISFGEIAELESLADHIEPGDVLLLEWAGVKEN